MKLRCHMPLIGFLAPAFVVSTLMLVCRECPPMDQLIGFYACAIGAAITCCAGIHAVPTDKA